MEKWTLDGLEGRVKKYVVKEEIFIVEDEFSSVNDCNKCQALKTKIKELEVDLEKVKRENVVIKGEYSKYMDYNDRSYAELNRKYKSLIEDILPKLQKCFPTSDK